MRSKTACTATVIVTLFAPAVALAQGLGLDLTQEGPDLQPSLAIVSLAATDQDIALSQRVERALVEIATARALFSRIVSGEQVQALLRSSDVPTQDCGDSSCLSALSHQLGVDRVLVLEVSSQTLRVVGFDWAAGVLVQAAIPRDQLGAGNLAGRLEPSISPLLQKLSTPLGELTVTTNVDRARIQWGSRLVGEGPSFQGAVPAGTQPVRVTADGHQPYEEIVTLSPGGTAKVEAELEVSEAPTPVAAVEEEFDPKPRPPKPLWRRPGLYAALAGAALFSVALAMGVSAKAAQSQMRDVDGDGLFEVTRAQALVAQRNAGVANLMGAFGVFGMGAGVGWLVLDSRDSTSTPKVGVVVRGNF